MPQTSPNLQRDPAGSGGGIEPVVEEVARQVM